ncbi:MAG: thioesterase family protein [Caldimonas sp.]
MNARIDPSLDPAPAAPADAAKQAPQPRSAYRRFVALGTRWLDNDAYGHVNNAVYYGFFDTAVNGVMIAAGALDIERGAVIGLVVESHCNYFAPLAFPQLIEAGIRVARVGDTSLRWEVGIFAAGAAESAARGHFVHVYVDRATRRPVPLPAGLRALAEELR